MKLVVSQQSAVGSQQSIVAWLSPISNMVNQVVKKRNICKTILVFLILTFQVGHAVCQNDTDSVLKAQLLEKGEETTLSSSSDTTLNASPVEMATGLRSNGKIYVVVAVLVIILAGLVFYLVRLDRKITSLEKGTWKDS